MPHSIAIITQEHDDFIKRRSHLLGVARLWQDDGLDVAVYTRPISGATADVAILHVNLTIVPQKFLDFAQTFPVALNGRVTDISKRVISPNILQQNSDYTGAVLVKADENYGGLPEQRLQEKMASLTTGGIEHALTGSQEHYKRLATTDYYVVDSLDQVAAEVWSNPYLVVEKFLPEREGEHFITRNWHFLGASEYHTKCYSHKPIVKSSNVLRREPIIEPIPEELRELRRQHNFDFGKWDYAIVDGQAVVFDMNKTPNLGALTHEYALPKLKILASGIYPLLQGISAQPPAAR